MRKPLQQFTAVLVLLACIPTSWATELTMEQWFRQFKQQASPQQLYQFVNALPKGADIHHHLSGAAFSEWWFELASDPAKNGGYRYFTRVELANCHGYGSNEFGPQRQYLMFRTIQTSTYQSLNDCEKATYRPLTELSDAQHQAFLNSIRLDKPHEGRNEFFETHWQRLNEMTANPTLMAQLLLKNMQAYQAEGVQYLETQVNVRGDIKPDGSRYSAEESLAIYQKMLDSEAAKNTGVTVRFQYSVLRFLPNAEDSLRWAYQFVDSHRDMYVGLNMVGREDDDKGHPLRFLNTLRSLRSQFPKVPLAFHAGEVDEPNHHVRDTLLLGADRIGHGLNTITDPDTLLLMRHGPYLIEINLISNLLLEYVSDYAQHPFSEYLRTDIPVALSTDDRGMWDSTLSDEFYVAVSQFNLSWAELQTLTRNSIQYSFLDEQQKQAELTKLDKRQQAFVQARLNLRPLPNAPQARQFICRFEPALCEQ